MPSAWVPNQPRPQGRGPIEADALGAILHRPSPNHGRKAVAPLKLDRGAKGAALRAANHGRKAVAPLKPNAEKDAAARATPTTAARPWPH